MAYDDEETIDDFEENSTYSPAGREEAIEDDEVDELEEGFMEGYEEGERAANCGLCKKLLGTDFIEEEIEGKLYRFCTEAHAEAFQRKHQDDIEED